MILLVKTFLCLRNNTKLGFGKYASVTANSVPSRFDGRAMVFVGNESKGSGASPL